MFQNYSNYTMAGSARDFMYKVYGWMGTALAISAAIAFYVASTPEVYTSLFRSPGLVLLICFAQLGIVLFLGWKIQKLSYSGVIASYVIYAALSGLTLSTVLLVYTFESVALTLVITAGMFSFMALYGYFTKADLTSLGNIILMGLFGLILAMFANMWFRSSVAEYYISLFGVAIFTLLTAYDVQNIKRLGESLMGDAESR